jgi:phage terminase large subunit
MRDWLRFFGWYLSEGCIDGDFTVQLSQTKERGRELIREALNNLGYGYGESKRGFTVYGKDLVNYLRQFGKSYDKFVPREILNLCPELLIYFFEAMIEGDGRRVTDTHCDCSTSSLQLANDLMEIGVKLGYATHMRTVDTSTYYPGGAPNHLVTFLRRNRVGVGKTKKVPYKGKVYCPETKPYHTLVTRYDGKVVITGNSSEWNYIWIEEATEFTWEEYQTIKLRLRAKSKDGIPNQIFLSFNPIDEMHWIKEKLVADPTQNLKEIVSSYKDNPFLPEEYIKDLENLQFQDISVYNVYTLGNWGKLENIIYKNWDTCPYIPDQTAVDRVFYGLDFGYNDPSALIECRVKGKDIWEKEHLYHTKLTNSDLISRLMTIIPEEKRQKHVIYADSAEPDRIKEIKDAGFRIRPAIKQVANGIDIVKRYNVHILEDSLNLIKEKRAYSWKKDRNGNVTDEPIGIWDHLMSAERYAIHSGLKGAGSIRVRFI